MKTFLNLTPHNVVLNDGTVYPKSGIVARVSQSFSPPDEDSIATQSYGATTDLPEPQEGVMFIVSLVVLTAVEKHRNDCVAPGSGAPGVVRDEKGQILSVPFLVRNAQ